MSQKKLPAWNFNLRLYVGGPMTGLPDFNRAKFRQVLEQLRQMGYHAEGPVDIEHPDFVYEDDSYEAKLKADFNVLHNCNGIVLLPGWTQSRGALAEFNYAATAGLFVFFWHEVPGINMGTLVRMDNWETDSGTTQSQESYNGYRSREEYEERACAWKRFLENSPPTKFIQHGTITGSYGPLRKDSEFYGGVLNPDHFRDGN